MHYHIKVGEDSIKIKVWRVTRAIGGADKRKLRYLLSFIGPYWESNNNESKSPLSYTSTFIHYYCNKFGGDLSSGPHLR